jgi:hypothetical protein
MIGIAPDRVLTGVEFAGYGECEMCRDLGLDGRLSFAASPQFGKKVIWHYSDAPSPEGVGLRVLQRSFDGRRPGDYVLFRFTITNTRLPSVTFYAGFFGDWDVSEDIVSDAMFTELDGRLMYVTDASAGSPFVGTLLAGDYPVAGNFVYPLSTFLSLGDQQDALSGNSRRPTLEGKSDKAYIHSLGPLTLARDQRAEFWVAIVAGESHDELLANAAAAAADIARRGGQDEKPLVGPSTLTVTRQPGSSGSARVVCKRCGAN